MLFCISEDKVWRFKEVLIKLSEMGL